MKNNKKYLTRAGAALLSVLLVFSCVLSRPAALNARAASLAGALALDEASMFLWNLLFTAFVGAGAYEAAQNDSYEMEAALYQGMVNYYMEQYGAVAVSDDMVFTLSDGSRYTLGDLITAARWDVVGTEGCYIPDEATWQRFKLSAPADESAFSSIAGVSLSADLLEHLAGFAGALAAGEVVGLEAADYFPDGFDGTLLQDAEGNYIGTAHIVLVNHQPNFGVSSGGIWPTYTYYDNYIYRVYDADFSFSAPFVLYMQEQESFWGSTAHTFSFYNIVALCNDGNKVLGIYSFSDRYSYNGSVSTGSGSLVSGTALVGFNHYDFWAAAEADDIAKLSWTLDYKSTNLPIFSSRAAAELFLNTGEFADCENLQLLDYPALADAIPDTLAPLLAKELAPDILLDLYPALMDALNPALNPDIADTKNPALVLDPVAATDAYEKAVADTVADVVDVAVSVPAVDTEIGSYKTDLTMIFPFCLPFDFIRLLDALDAEPVTPVFEFPFVVPALDIDITVELDMSFLEPAMEVFRTGETVGFIILLIVLTQRVIKW